MLCPEYTLNHNRKENNYIPQIHVHLELAQTTISTNTIVNMTMSGAVLGFLGWWGREVGGS